MSQDELTKAIINIINKELGVVKEILPKDLLKNLQKVISPELENLIEKSGYVSKSKYKALEKLAQELEEYGKVEQLPKLEGKRMIMFIAPKKVK